MKYLDEYVSPKTRFMHINIALIFKILFSDNPLEIVFYCENLNYVEQLSNLLKERRLSEKANIKIIIATENFKGSRPDLNIVVGDINEKIRETIFANSSLGTLLWFKDSKRVLEEFESFCAQDGLDDMLPF